MITNPTPWLLKKKQREETRGGAGRGELTGRRAKANVHRRDRRRNARSEIPREKYWKPAPTPAFTNDSPTRGENTSFDDAPNSSYHRRISLCWAHDDGITKIISGNTPSCERTETVPCRLLGILSEIITTKRAPSQEAASELSLNLIVCFLSRPLSGFKNRKDQTKKACLLLVLKYPDILLHNNASELAARAQLRKRDVSLHTVTQEGTQANDTFLTITQTCKSWVLVRMNISLIVSVAFKLPSAQIIRKTHPSFSEILSGT